jgi:hypothetical protein
MPAKGGSATEHCVAVNVNPGGMQWNINLIGYDVPRSFYSAATGVGPKGIFPT